MGVTAIEVEGLGKRYTLGATRGANDYGTLRDSLASLRRRRSDAPAREFWAVQDISFDLGQGEILGIIGRNGAGKSTLLKLLARVTSPTTGRARITGRVGSLLEVGTGFHPELSGRENILLNGAILGMGRREIQSKQEQIVDFAGVERFLDTPVKRYSSGMYLRLAFAVAAHLEPEILLVDEVLAVGDADFQKKCLGRMGEIGASGRTVVFISHSMPAMLRLCPRLLLLEQGRVKLDGPAHDVVRAYLGSDSGTTAVRTWDDPTSAPGDDVARLRAARVLDGGSPSDTIDIRRPIDVEVEYWHLSEDPAWRPSVALQVSDAEGNLLFLTHDFSNRAWRRSPRSPGVMRAVCRIPGNFLAEGQHSITVSASSHHPDKGHFDERDALTFTVVDRSDGDGVRGDYQREWPGLVRPMLDWDVQPLP